jgi:class 3 adenylate cyclase
MTLDPNLRAGLKRYLPEPMLAQLPDPQASAAAIRRLNSLQQSISSFLPQYIAENEQLYSQDYGDLRPGTFMFADVSGFTALSEKLQRRGGREGAEIMTQIINDFFARMLDILAKSNGQLLKFAGDALLTFFPALSGEDETPLAIRTGLRMQREMKANFQPIDHPMLHEFFGEHHLELSMSIGVCCGKLFEAVVGNNVQRDHIIQGDLPGQAMAAEAAGERDDVIVTAELKEAYSDLFEMEPVGDGFFRVIDSLGDRLSDYEFVIPRRRRAQAAVLLGLSDENLLEDLAHSLERLDAVARFVAREVVDKLAFKGDHIESENRAATVIFAHATGFAELLEEWGEDQLPLLVSILGRYYNLMQRTVSANGGTLNRSDPYQRGAKLLITFGAPVAHPDDPERAVTTALEMNRQLASFNARLRDELPEQLQRETFITQRCGITHGMTFAGLVGPLWRREYTVMGDEVNLAARLMSKGEAGQILISERVWERVHPHFETEALPPLRLKGKSQPVQAYLVRASTASPLSRSATSDTPFVGRDLQLLSLTYALQQAKGPRRCQVFALRGEAGVGKTRMAKQVAQAAEGSGFRVAWANCQLSHSQDQSMWAALIFQLLQLEQAKSEPAQRRLLHVRLSELGLAELDVVFSLLLFGSTERPVGRADRLIPPSPVPDASQADSTPQTAAKGPNIFELVRTKTDPTKSGIFGIASERLQAALEADSTPSERSFWQSVQKQIGLPDSIVRFLQVFADQTPVLLVVDDLHRGDAASLAILKRVLNDITRARLMLLLAHEPMDGQEDLQVRRKIDVADLDEDDTAQLAARVLAVGELGPQLRRLVWDRTKGRPLFVESLLRMLQHDGQIERGQNRAELAPGIAVEALPDNVRELIMSQIDRLSPDARELLQVASVLGDGFAADALVALVEGGDLGRLETLLGELIFQEIVEPLPDATYRFRHGLAQATVYESLNRLQRQKLHRSAANFLKQKPDSDRNVLKIAYHLVKGGMPMRGIELVFGAADQAEHNQQIDRAIELYTHALEIFPHDESVRAQLDRLQKGRC